jgi:hypothetical protein
LQRRTSATRRDGERDRTVVVLPTDDPARRKAEPVGVNGNGSIENVDAERQYGNAGPHIVFLPAFGIQGAVERPRQPTTGLCRELAQ